MGHDTDGWPVRVYRYGAPGWGGKRAITLSDRGHDQMRLAHRLRNDLVEVAETADARMAAWWADRLPDVYAALADAQAARESAWQGVQRARSVQRRRDVTGPEVDIYQAATAVLRAASAAVKAAQAGVRADDPDGVREMLTQTRAASAAAGKALYARYSEAGLYWATINAVRDDARVAEQRVIAARTAGRPSARRYARWDGSGRIAVQLQRASGDPRRTGVLLASGAGKWRNVLTIGPSEYGPRLRRVEFSTGRGQPPVGVDVAWHRDLPTGGDVTSAELVAHRIAGRTRYSVHFAVRVAPPVPVTAGPDLAVHLGWRQEPGGGVRAATWQSTVPLQVPAEMVGFVTADTPTGGRVIVPGALLERLARADEIRGGRDVALDEIRATLAAWLDQHPQPSLRDGDPDLTGPVVRAWRSPARFVALTAAWRADPREELDDIATQLETWRCADRRAWEREANLRSRTVGYRRDLYRQVAAWASTTAGRVVVDDTDLRQVIARAKTGDLLPGTAEAAIAGRRADVAPGDLRAAVVQAAIRDGVPVVTVPHKGGTVTHHACGASLPADERWLRPIVTCDRCGRDFDQDVNAAAGMLARAVQ